MKIDFTHLGVLIPHDLKAALKDAAARDGNRSISSLVLKVLTDWAKEKGFLK